MTCNLCHQDNCCGECRPARYSQGFPDCGDPFGNTNGETDTTLSINYDGATLNYQAERHNDTIAGSDLGSIINLGDLRDVDTESDTDAMCSELIYHRYGDCGDGCRSLEDKWSRFSLDDEGAKNDNIRYVRGANAYGCPVFLDVPTNESEYWFAGWRASGDDVQFGYYQTKPVEELPTDENGNTLVVSLDPDTKQPIIGPLKTSCVINNLVANLATEVFGSWSVLQATPQFQLSFNNVTGDFQINWSDWNDLAGTDRAGYGVLTGTVFWDFTFDDKTGTLKYELKSVYFKSAKWTMDRGVTQPTSPSLTVSGVKPNGEKVEVLKVLNFGHENWEREINQQVEFAHTISLAPGQTAGPLNFAHIYVDWIGDDEGYEQINFRNKLAGWTEC